jgi:hypothetical protein
VSPEPSTHVYDLSTVARKRYREILLPLRFLAVTLFLIYLGILAAGLIVRGYKPIDLPLGIVLAGLGLGLWVVAGLGMRMPPVELRIAGSRAVLVGHRGRELSIPSTAGRTRIQLRDHSADPSPWASEADRFPLQIGYWGIVPLTPNAFEALMLFLRSSPEVRLTYEGPRPGSPRSKIWEFVA